MPLFHNRMEAAHELAGQLTFLRSENPIVLGLPNGAVPIAEVIAKALEAPLDVLFLSRLALPEDPAEIVGAVDEHGRVSAIRSAARWQEVSSQKLIAPAREAFRDLQRRSGRVRAILPELEVRDRTVLVVSEGIVTGAKVLGAICSLRDRNARKVVITAPAGAAHTTHLLSDAADLVIIPHRPEGVTAVRDFYSKFPAVTDEQVIAVVERLAKSRPDQQAGLRTLKMRLTNDEGRLLTCEIDLPPGATRGSGPYPTVLFAHNYKSDGRSPRTMPIARRLAEIGVLCIRVDFTGHGQSEGDLRAVTAERMDNDLKTVFREVRKLTEVDPDRMGLVGSGSGAMLALNLAAEVPSILAVAVRSPLCGAELDAVMHVEAPTILIYTDEDMEFVHASGEPGHRLPDRHESLLVPESTHEFSDAISRKMMVGATVDWMDDHLTRS